MARRTRIRVNPAVCDGFGFCAEILPEMIGRDEWGFPIVGRGEIPEGLAEAAEEAVRFCPRRALEFEKENERAGTPGQA
jgi:ferredoxin